MKPLLFLLACFLLHAFPAAAYSDTTITVTDVQDYEAKKVSSDFSVFIKGDMNYKKLRDYLVKKKTTLGLLQKKLGVLLVSYRDSTYFSNQVETYKNILLRNRAKDSVLLYTDGEPARYYTMPEIKNLIEHVENDLEPVRQFDKNLDIKEEFVKENISVVENDIASCEDVIDQYLNPEISNQSFKREISIIFSLVVALLLLTFFAFIWAKSESSISRELLSGNGLQFITLFILIIAIILFGILGILESKELAAILSGIAGYILGKGITPTAPAPAAPVAPVTPAPVTPAPVIVPVSKDTPEIITEVKE